MPPLKTGDTELVMLKAGFMIRRRVIVEVLDENRIPVKHLRTNSDDAAIAFVESVEAERKVRW